MHEFVMRMPAPSAASAVPTTKVLLIPARCHDELNARVLWAARVNTRGKNVVMEGAGASGGAPNGLFA